LKTDNLIVASSHLVKEKSKVRPVSVCVYAIPKLAPLDGKALGFARVSGA